MPGGIVQELRRDGSHRYCSKSRVWGPSDFLTANGDVNHGFIEFCGVASGFSYQQSRPLGTNLITSNFNEWKRRATSPYMDETVRLVQVTADEAAIVGFCSLPVRLGVGRLRGKSGKDHRVLRPCTKKEVGLRGDHYWSFSFLTPAPPQTCIPLPAPFADASDAMDLLRCNASAAQ